MGIVVFVLLGSVIGIITYVTLPLSRKRKASPLRTVAGSVAGAFEGGLLVCLLTNQQFTDVEVFASLASIAGAIAMPRLVEKISNLPARPTQVAPLDAAPPSSPWPRQRRRSADSVPPTSAPRSGRRVSVGPPSSKPSSSRRGSKALTAGGISRMLARLFKV